MRSSLSFARSRLDPRRALGSYIKGALESRAGTSQRALIEEAADEGDAVRHAAGWRKLGQRAGGVGRPIAACLGHVDEARAEGERGMSGEVADGEHFVAQRRHQDRKS